MNENASGLDARTARRHAGQVLKHLLGQPPREVKALGGGLSNFVFSVRHGRDELVMRLNSNPAKVKDYLKEQWAMARAAERGVPVPEVLEVGAHPLPFMVSRRVPGTEGTHHPERRQVLEELGRMAKLIHAVPTNGFGHTFDWSENVLSRRDTWREYMDREFHGEQRLEILEKNDMLPPAAVKSLRATLRAMRGWDIAPALNHGDLRLKNVIVGDDGRIAALLDWEFCSSHAAPWWDMSLALHDLSVDAKQAFLEGYGMSPEQVLEAAPVLRAFNVLNYAQAVDRAARKRDAAQLDWLRLRLRGGLEMYAF
jgi:hygromycin-B 4-O-kinase